MALLKQDIASLSFLQGTAVRDHGEGSLPTEVAVSRWVLWCWGSPPVLNAPFRQLSVEVFLALYLL